MDENKSLGNDLAQLVRLALAEQSEDVRLFVARLVRKYRNFHPELAEQLDLHLRTKVPRTSAPMRKTKPPTEPAHALPVDDESRLSLLKVFKDPPTREQPLLSVDLEETLGQLIQERRQMDRLASMGLSPTRSAIFVGPPGVGKTLTTRWVASQLGLPLYVLDLTAVMSSLLGRSGSNLRAALDFAKRSPCVLLLDEIDAIAKRRSDDTDVGELKRLVTVILQEVDEWPASGLLLAATRPWTPPRPPAGKQSASMGWRSRQVEVTYLTSETTEPMTLTARKLETRRNKLQNIVRGVRLPCASLCRKVSPRSRRSSPEVGDLRRQDDAAPSLRPHYRGLIATTGGSAPPPQHRYSSSW